MIIPSASAPLYPLTSDFTLIVVGFVLQGSFDGAIDNLRGLSSGAAFSDAIKPAVSQHHGYADLEPQRGEVLVKVRAVSLNHRDIAIPLGRDVWDARVTTVSNADAITRRDHHVATIARHGRIGWE
jgi:hypothetical protein